MSGFEYRVIPAPSLAKKVKGAKTLGERFAHGLAEVMNTEAREGWEYVGHERFQVEGKTGLFSKSKSSEETYLIFRRMVDAKASMPLERRLETMVEMRARNKPAAVAPPVAPVLPAQTITPVPPPAPEPNKVAEASTEFLQDTPQDDTVDEAEFTPIDPDAAVRNPDRAEPRMRSGDAKGTSTSGIFSPLSSRDPDAEEKNAPSLGPAGRQ